MNLDILTYTASAGTATRNGPDGVHFETPAPQWSYALVLPLPASLDLPAVIDVSVDVRSGRLGVGCVDESLSRYVGGETIVDAGGGRRSARVYLDRPQARSLVIRNVAVGASNGTLVSVRIARPADYPSADLKRTRAGQFPYWHYSFDLGDGVTVAESLRGGMAAHRINQRLLLGLLTKHFDVAHLKTCLDAGCSSGYHSFALARLGLAVTAIDFDQTLIDQAQFVQSCSQDPREATVVFRRQDVLEVDAVAAYDLVFCSGVFYHLRDLVGAAERLFRAAKRGAVIHSCVSSAPGEIMELADASRFPCCFPGEFSFVPTPAMLSRIFNYVGFRELERTSPPEICGRDELNALEPLYAQLMTQHTAYYILEK